jgi:CheY-like chemotaxis protein
LQEKQAEYVNTIKKSSETLLNILNDILDISKIEAGKMKLRKQTVNLTETLEKLTTLFAQKAEEKGITLNYHIDRKIPKYIEADETRLLQILSNLTSNAIKFTEQGGVSIQVRLKEQTENNLIIQCNVTDTGIGISAEDKNFLFDYFSQLDNSTTKIYGGTGLGLAISKQLCHMMQGDIWVDSEEGKGSTFSFTFKTKAVRPKKKSAETDETNNAFTTFEINQQPELLLVDDNAINQKVASEILLRANCKITTAFSGKKAIELIKNKTFDLIFMDIQMPEMDGITAAQHIKALLKEKTPPIIAMTAYSMSEDREKFITAGMDDYLAKPIKAQQLLAKVKEWVCQTQKSKKTTRTEQSTKNTVLAEKQIKNYIIFDQETIKNLQEMIGKEMLLETLQDFEKETKVILENCSKALQINDYETIKHELHTLKGTAGTLGIITISHLAFETEQLLKSKEQTPNTNEVISKINDLKQAFQQFCEQYTEIIV